ncbi:MAG: hypothetical protein ABSE90_05295 [Verrucomicrobiota bacterium]
MFAFSLILTLAGCGRDDVKVYRVAKEQEQPQQQTATALPTDSPNPTLPPGHPDISSAPTMAAPLASEPAQSPLTWKMPEGWTEIPPSEMRVASFKVAGKDGKQADVSIIPLPGMSGTDAANVNRWRGQVGLTVMTDDEMQKLVENVEAGGQPAQLYDIAGTNPGSSSAERILGVIQHRDGMAWFYKMTGDADLVEQQKPAFVEFLKSLKFTTARASGNAGEMPATLPPGHPAIGDVTTPATASAPVSHEGQPNWQVPAGWQEVPAGQFLAAKFTLTGDGGATAGVNVSSSPGVGGGLAANVNRWRGQLGLAFQSEMLKPPQIDVEGGKAWLVEIDGTSPQTGKPTKLIGIIVPQAGQTWFYKLMGDPKVVESQKAAFTQFVQGVKY